MAFVTDRGDQFGARDRAGLSTGNDAIGVRGGLGIARTDLVPREKCKQTLIVTVPYTVNQGNGWIKAVMPNGTKKVLIQIQAGPSDAVVIDDQGRAIGIVPGCGQGSFLVGSCSVGPLEGGSKTYIEANEYPYPAGLIRTYCLGYDKWGEYSNGSSTYNQLIQANATECGYLPPIPGLTITQVNQTKMDNTDFIQNYGPALFDIRVPGAVGLYLVHINITKNSNQPYPELPEIAELPFSIDIMVGNSPVRVEVPLIDFKPIGISFNIRFTYFEISANSGQLNRTLSFSVSENPYIFQAHIFEFSYGPNGPWNILGTFGKIREVVNGTALATMETVDLRFVVANTLDCYVMVYGASPKTLYTRLNFTKRPQDILKPFPGADQNGYLFLPPFVCPGVSDFDWFNNPDPITKGVKAFSFQLPYDSWRHF